MIESTKFNKMLHILKQNADDLNIRICIVGYDVAKECDYEVITLHLKETNTQNNTSVYKDLIIRSQLYYDEIDDKYYSALDGDIILESKPLAKINILTEIHEDTFTEENVEIVVNLVDAETLEPLQNQIIYMYLSSSPNESVLSAKTNEYGEAFFYIYMPDMNMTTGEYVLYFQYNGNKIYRQSISEYILVNFDEMKNKHIKSNVTAYIQPNESLVMTYNTQFNNTNWIDGFKEYSSLNVNEDDLLRGNVWFYAVKDNIRTFLGGGYLRNTTNQTYSSVFTSFPKAYYNQEFNIEAEFSGNNYFPSNIASTSITLNRVMPENIELEVLDMNEDDINVINDEGFKTKLTFAVDVSNIDMTSSVYESGLNRLYQSFGEVQFYLYNANNGWGTLIRELPFYISDNLMLTDDNNILTISTETDFLSINLDNYGLSEGDSLYIKADYSGNAIISDFSINNKPRQTRGKSEER